VVVTLPDVEKAMGEPSEHEKPASPSPEDPELFADAREALAEAREALLTERERQADRRDAELEDQLNRAVERDARADARNHKAAERRAADQELRAELERQAQRLSELIDAADARDRAAEIATGPRKPVVSRPLCARSSAVGVISSMPGTTHRHTSTGCGRVRTGTLPRTTGLNCPTWLRVIRNETTPERPN
jgi:hypothetical protein